jgi:SulP family sulfate permease
LRRPLYPAPATCRIPGSIAGLIGGTALFQIIVHVNRSHPPTVPQHWVIGALPALSEFRPRHRRPRFYGRSAVAADPARRLRLGGAVFLEHAVLTSVLADTTTGLRHNARRELLAQSIGQIAVGLTGGMAGSASVGGTVTAIQAGARRWAAPAAGGVLLLLLLFSGPVGQWLPTSALAGIIIASALNLVETDIVAWARRRRTRMDAAVALLVTGVTLGYDLMIAVLVGLVIAILLFIRAQSRVPIIHRRRPPSSAPRCGNGRWSRPNCWPGTATAS